MVHLCAKIIKNKFKNKNLFVMIYRNHQLYSTVQYKLHTEFQHIDLRQSFSKPFETANNKHEYCV